MNLITQEFIKVAAGCDVLHIHSDGEIYIELQYVSYKEASHFSQWIEEARVYVGNGGNLGRTKLDKNLQAFAQNRYDFYGFASNKENNRIRFNFESQEELFIAVQQLLPLLDLDLYTQLWSKS